jgi:hypothetical protein
MLRICTLRSSGRCSGPLRTSYPKSLNRGCRVTIRLPWLSGVGLGCDRAVERSGDFLWPHILTLSYAEILSF